MGTERVHFSGFSITSWSLTYDRIAAKIVCFALSACFILAVPSKAQTTAQDVASQQVKKAIQDAATTGIPLPTTADVDSSVNIEAVMLPASVVNNVFGREVSKRYAVIEINMSNRNIAAGFILQSLFIDYSRWALAQPLSIGGISQQGKPFQSRASTQQVSSVEYRIVRGQMLDQQPWTKRNFSLRTIKVLGSIGTSFAFPFSRDVVTGIGAWNGAVVPGFEVLFPDGMEGQMNRVSDYGFRNNKIIPQQSADIVVAFFPIDRFLSPSLRQIFLETPALFFNPFLMAIDPDTQKKLRPILRNALGNDEKVDKAIRSLMTEIAGLNVQELAEVQEEFQRRQEMFYRDNQAQTELLSKSVSGLTASELATRERTMEEITNKIDKDSADLKLVRDRRDALYQPLRKNLLFNFLSQISLTNINIVVSGVMTVDQSTVPAKIESTCFDKADASLWAISGKKTCFVKGQFMTNGTPQILGVNPEDPGISNISVDRDNSTPELLKFSFDLKHSLDPGTTIDILVTKPGKDGAQVESMKYRQTASYLLPAPIIETVSTDSSGVTTVTGSGFYSNSANSFSLLLLKPGGDQTSGTKVLDAPPADAKKLELDASILKTVNPGCYQVVINVGTARAISPAQQLARVDPVISGAKRDGTKISLSGTTVDSISGCSDDLTVEFLDSKNQVIGSARKFKDGSLQKDSLTFDLGNDAANVTGVRFTGRDTVPLS